MLDKKFHRTAISLRLLRSSPYIPLGTAAAERPFAESQRTNIKMKAKIIILALSGLIAANLAANAQDNSAAATQSAQSDVTSAATTTTTSDSTPAAAPATDATAAEKQAALSAVSVAQADTTPPQTQAATFQEAPKSSEATTNVVMPVIMDNVELTVAIQNLARMAKLNYILDPKLNFGGVGPDGKPVTQPVVSVRWEGVTAEQALHALLTTYGLQIIEDPKTHIARIAAQDPAAAPPVFTRIVQLKFASPSNLVAAVQSTFNDKDKRSKVIADVRSSQLVIVATEKELDAVEKLIEKLDTPTKQVLIEAKLLETRVNPSTIKGVDWHGTLANQHVTLGNNALPGTPPTPASTVLDANGNPVSVPATPGTIGGILNGIGAGQGVLGNLSAGSFFQPAMAFLNADGVSLALSFLNSYADTKLISSPRTVTLDNETSEIEVGQQYPIVNVTAGTANTTGGSTISYSNLTVRLDVTPRISANNYINLKVRPRAMRLQQVQRFTSGSQSFDVPIFDTRTIDTTVMIPSGHTLVMGGLMEDAVNTGHSKVPVLGDIPYFGYLFRREAKDRETKNLIVFITPTVVEDTDFQPTKTQFLKSPVPTSDYVDKEWSAWDSGKPKDWSKTSHSYSE
jgi:type II secretory pathway component GspD/PulD (secretin)